MSCCTIENEMQFWSTELWQNLHDILVLLALLYGLDYWDIPFAID